MASILLIHSFFFIVLLSADKSQGLQCPNEFIQCFHMSNGSYGPLFDAQDYCAARSTSKLWLPETAQEMAAIHNKYQHNLRKTGDTLWTGWARMRNVLVGYNYPFDENGFVGVEKWGAVSNSTLSMPDNLSWKEGEPNNVRGVESCVSANFEGNDWGLKLYVDCEYSGNDKDKHRYALCEVS
ncbi:uncharacterized protein LOC142350977 isoform X2 [Convolutriloba macropyga]|uniref:uncharacterized protein LOC142350977 isoform X2 n=1 Tax=Convolutriloba macropyga TaxID=536237 RepID=UPI003F5278F7